MKKTCVPLIWSMILFIMIINAPLCISYADDVDCRIKTSLSEEYNDNLFSTLDHKLHDESSILSSQVDLTKDDERLKTNLSGGLTGKFYQKYHSQNNEDWTVSAGVSWDLSETANLSSSVRSGKNTNMDRTFSETGLLLVNSEQKTLDWNGTYGRSLDERFFLQISWDCSKETDKTGDISILDQSMTAKSIGSMVSYQYDETLYLNLNTGYGKYDYKTSTVDQAYVSLGLKKAIDDTVNLSVSAGSRYTTYVNDVITGVDFFSDPISYIYGKERSHTWGFIGNAGLNVNLDNGMFSLFVDESLQPSAGLGQSLSRTLFSASYSRMIDFKWSYMLSANYWINKSDGPSFSTPVHSDSYQISPGLTYRVTDDFSLSGNYSYTGNRSNTYDGEVKKNTVRFTGEYNF